MSFSRRVFLVALLIAAATMAFTCAMACSTGCASCVGNICTACESGYYYGANGCTPCGAANCDRCEAVGWCIACKAGYHLQYVTGSTDVNINKYGKCVNAASHVSAHTALIAAAAALVYAVVA